MSMFSEIEAHEAARDERGRELCARHVELLRARKDGANVDAELRAMSEEMAALAAETVYTAQLGEWPGAA